MTTKEQELTEMLKFGNTRREIVQRANELIQEVRKELIKEFEKMIDGDIIYPKDIFPEITKKQLSQINNFLEQLHGFPIDRLSAHISRGILKGLYYKIQELKSKEKK